MLYGLYVIQYVNDKVSKRAKKNPIKTVSHVTKKRNSRRQQGQRTWAGSRPRGAERLIKAHLIIFHKIFLSGCYDSQNVRWPVINSDFHSNPPPPTRVRDVILDELFSHHALLLSARRPHGITGTFTNISVCICAEFIVSGRLDFSLKVQEGRWAIVYFHALKLFFDNSNKPSFETLSVWLTVHFTLCLSCVSSDGFFRNVYNGLLTRLTLKNVWFQV